MSRAFTMRIKLVDALDEAPAFGDGLARQPRLRVVKAGDIPPIRRHVADSLSALDEKLPERVRVIDSARKTAPDSDDCNTVFGHECVKRGIARGATDIRLSHPVKPREVFIATPTRSDQPTNPQRMRSPAWWGAK